MVLGPRVPQPVINQVTEEKIQVAIHSEYPEQTIAIGSTLTEEGPKELCGLLRRNLNVFVMRSSLDFNKKFYNSLGRAPNHCSSSIGKTRGVIIVIKISKFMHGITNPELIKQLHDKIPKLVDEMMRVTTSFLRGKVAASNYDGRSHFYYGNSKKSTKAKLQEGRLPEPTKAEEKAGQFKPPSPMTTPVEKRNASKFYEFHREVRHTTDECMHLKRQIEEMLKTRNLSHLIKELKKSNGKDQAKAAKKGETSGKDKPLVILMIQPWQRVARQKITQTFSPESMISFPPLREEDGTEGPMIIEAEIGGHCVHRMYVDGGSSS
ncbi:hypothetical protein Tco_0158518 [Tanacetum coccineum]